MPWIKVDDHYDEHPKFARAGPLAVPLWLAGMAYCNRNLTDGFIPWSVARGMVSWEWLEGSSPTRIYVGSDSAVYEEDIVTSDYVIRLLLDSGLWIEAPGGYRVHDYDEYQPTKAEVEADRAAKAASGRAGGLATARARAAAAVQRNGSGRSSETPAKTQPVPVPVPVPVDERDSGVLGPIGPFPAGARASGGVRP
jgi:hypothetical protein